MTVHPHDQRSSTVPGQEISEWRWHMHARGHDTHAALRLGAAKVLSGDILGMR